MQRFRSGLGFKAHRLLYHSTLGLRVIKKKKTPLALASWERAAMMPSPSMLPLPIPPLPSYGSEEGSYLRLIDFCITQL